MSESMQEQLQKLHQQKKQQGSGTEQTTHQNQQQAHQQTTHRPSYQTTAGGLTIRNIVTTGFDGGASYEEVYKKALELVTAVNKDSGGAVNLSVHKVMKREFGNAFSAIAIANSFIGANNQKQVVYHTLLIEATGDVPAPHVYQAYNKTVTMYRKPAEALDDKFMGSARVAIRQQLALQESVKIISVDGYVFAREIDVTDEESVMSALYVSVTAVYSETLAIAEGVVGEPITALTSKEGSRFGLNIKYNSPNQIFYNEAGMPIRKDVELHVAIRHGQSNDRSMNDGKMEELVGVVSGYFDLRFNPNFRGNPYAPQGHNNYQDYPYRIMFVATDYRTGDGTLMTPSVIWLLNGAIPELAAQWMWIDYFIERANVSGKDIDYNNVSLLNIQANMMNDPKGYGDPIKVNDPKLAERGAGTYIASNVDPRLILAIDVPSAGPNTWFLSAFRHAAKNNSDMATARLINGISTLIGRPFSSKHRMFGTGGCKVSGGYFTVKGERRDLRCIESYLGFAALATSNNGGVADIAAFNNTFIMRGVDDEVRQADRLEMFKAFGIQFVLKEDIDRVIVNGDFLDDVAVALKSKGYILDPNDTRNMGYGVNNQTYEDMYSNAGMSGQIRMTGSSGRGGYTSHYQGYGRQY